MDHSCKKMLSWFRVDVHTSIWPPFILGPSVIFQMSASGISTCHTLHLCRSEAKAYLVFLYQNMCSVGFQAVGILDGGPRTGCCYLAVLTPANHATQQFFKSPYLLPIAMSKKKPLSDFKRRLSTVCSIGFRTL
jgi:hypothetical protein